MARPPHPHLPKAGDSRPAPPSRAALLALAALLGRAAARELGRGLDANPAQPQEPLHDADHQA